MIKLIVTDLDGTLLNSSKQYSPRLLPLLDLLEDRNIDFAFASGRDVGSISSNYPEIADRIGIIAENGLSLAYKKKLIYRNELSSEEINTVADVIGDSEGLHPIMFGSKGVYYLTHETDIDFINRIRKYISSSKVISDFRSVIGNDSITRITVYSENDADTCNKLSRLSQDFIILPSGEGWIDIVKKGNDKGTGLRYLQNYLDVSSEETMCFGDYINDIALMKNCYYSFAMKNAHPMLFSYSKYITEWTNEEDGVIRTIHQILNL